MRPIYLWQYPTGPKFTWNDSDLITLLSEVRNLEDVLRSSEIEGVILNSDRVRSSIARHLGIETVGLRLTRTITDMLLAKADGFPFRFYSMSAEILCEKKSYFCI